MEDNRYTVKASFDLNAAKAADRATQRNFYIVMWAFLALVVLMGVLNVCVLGNDDLPFWGGMAGALLVLILVYRLLYPRLLLRNYNKKVGEVVYNFGDEGIRAETALAQDTLRYELLVKLIDTKDYILLYPQKNSAYVLPKAGFTQGSAADFLPFIEQKTGLTAKHI